MLTVTSGRPGARGAEGAPPTMTARRVRSRGSGRPAQRPLGRRVSAQGAPQAERGRQGDLAGAAGQIEPAVRKPPAGAGGGRSEEHTSELQSLMRISYAVFCLKKKKQNAKKKKEQNLYTVQE